MQVHENLEVKMPRARDHEAVETARDVLDLCGVQAVSNQAAADLRSVMDTPHFKVSQYLFSLLLLIIINQFYICTYVFAATDLLTVVKCDHILKLDSICSL